MKHAKKLLALLLAVVMIAAMLAVPALADDTGSITVQNATVGKEYAAYKAFDLIYDDTTTPVTVVYTYTATGDDDPFLAALQGASSPFTVTATSTTYVYTIEAKDSVAGDTIAAFLGTNKGTGNFQQVGSTITATVDTFTFSGLAYGYYYITSSLGTTATVTSTLPDVTVVDKNQGPTWGDPEEDPTDPDEPPEDPKTPGNGKYIFTTDSEGNVTGKVTENTANYGETVSFGIGVNAVAFIGDDLVTNYVIEDTLGAGFTDPFGNLKVYVYKVVDNGGTKEYEDGVEITSACTITKDGNDLEVIVPFGMKYGANAKIEVRYTAVVAADGEDVVLGPDGNPNTATFKYYLDTDYDPDDPTDDPTNPDGPSGDPEEPSEPSETKTYVFGIDLLKVDGADGATPLENAEFELYLGTDLVKFAMDGTDYIYAKDGTVTTLVSDADGKVVVKGLAGGTYSLKETEAPEGYNLLTEPVSITLSKTADVDANDLYPETVENNSGTVLPETGGIGTTLFITIGALVMVGGGIFFMTNQRMRKEGF